MLSREENEILTRVGASTPMGELMRRYWIPALLSEEIPAPDCPPVRVRLLGEDLVAFRDSQGRVGLLGEHCAHRGASLFFGRNEECGLRCVYHGWKYDVDGNVLDTPAEPADSDFKKKLRHVAYPCKEVASMIFTYMGPAEKQPLIPRYEWFTLAEEQVCPVKSYLECNYLQGIEGDFDSSHTSFLHNNNIKNAERLKRDGAPILDAEDTSYGMRAISIRTVGTDKIYVRASPYMMPSFSIVPGPPTAKFEEDDIRGFRFWVPIDDQTTWLYILNMRKRPFTDEERKSLRSWIGADYRRIRNLGNNYLQNREVQGTASYTGIEAFNPAEQDGCATESMGAIWDRSKEHLGYSDKTIIALRKMLLRAVSDVAEGKEPRHIIRDPQCNDFSKLRSIKGVLPVGTDWRQIMDGMGPSDG
ncbi:MAG TPA: Rieske 2Fe-2S domain-containing protein [Candidatus Binatia bacterium]|jgi:phenylpropionate dioxygenase-like ring-hydroxylating dioxygenase large terminal subunit|nr:Rieske 2Fe-2S domain-containing protein [Candidatus Binatia bacterium]